jgi:heme-degrading monooxygenase HmoA
MMYARVSTYEGPPERLDEAVAAFDDNDISGLEGLEDAFLLVDRTSGQMMTITIWDGEAALRRTSDAAAEIRRESAGAGGHLVTGVTAYEVALTARDEIAERRARD